MISIRRIFLSLALVAASSCSSNQTAGLPGGTPPNQTGASQERGHSARTAIGRIRPQVGSGVATIVQSKTCNTDSDITSYTCSLPNSVASGDQTLVMVGSSVPTTITAGYSKVGSVTNTTSTITAYDAANGTQTVSFTFSSAIDVHVVFLEIANGGTPTGFASSQTSTAPSLTASANSIVFNMFGEQYGFAYGGNTVPAGWTEFYPPSPASAGSGYNQIDTFAYASAVGGQQYQLSDYSYKLAASFQIPSVVATPAPTMTPSGPISIKQSKTCNTDSQVTSYSCSLANPVTAGDQTLAMIGANLPASVTSGYTRVGTVSNSTSTMTAYDAAAGTQTVAFTFSSAIDAHVVLLEIANGASPSGFTAVQGSTAPSATATANAIVFDMFAEKYGFAYGGNTVPSGWYEYYPPSPGSAGNGYNQIDTFAHPSSVAGTQYALTDYSYSESASFQIAMAGATPAPTSSPKPTPTPTGTAYDSLKRFSPSGGSYSYYPSSPFHAQIPASPALVSPSQSAAWNAMQASDDFGAISASEDGSNVNDGSDPTTYTNGDGTGFVLACNKQSYSQYSCQSSANVRNINGATVKFPLGVITAGDSDHHVVNIDVAAGIEDDIWLGRPVPTGAGSTWSVGGGGECALSGSGVGCGGSIATGMANSLGLVRAEDILYCLNGSSPTTCTLPYAVSIALACNGSGVEYPATASDSQCAGNQGTATTAIAEGTRGCLNMTDAQINAASYRSDEKVVYRTMDCQHFGVFDRDSAYYAGPGLSIQFQGAQAYAAFGETDPWKTLAAAVGISKSNTADYIFPYNMTQPAFVWCANSKNDGLCD